MPKMPIYLSVSTYMRTRGNLESFGHCSKCFNMKGRDLFLLFLENWYACTIIFCKGNMELYWKKKLYYYSIKKNTLSNIFPNILHTLVCYFFFQKKKIFRVDKFFVMNYLLNKYWMWKVQFCRKKHTKEHMVR
jgi:hypothetical protein